MLIAQVQLYPDLHSHGAKVTQIVVEAQAPVYNEIFAFKIRHKELQDTKLVAQVRLTFHMFYFLAIAFIFLSDMFLL